MATNPAIKPRRGTSTPGAGAILQHELAIDTTNKRIFIGAADGSGTLVGSAPGGSDTYVQFNDSGVLGGDSGLTYNKTTDTLTVSGDLAVDGGDITTTSTGTFNIVNSNATGVQIGTGAATDVRIGKTDSTGTNRLYGTTNIVGGTLNTGAATSSLFDTTATTLSIGGAAALCTLGYNSTGASTTNISNGAVGSGNTKTVNLGTGGGAGSTTNVNIGSNVGGSTTINSSTILGVSGTQNVFNTVATALNFGGAATALTMGATSGTASIRNAILNLGSTTSTIATNSGSSNHLSISPFGKINLVPTTNLTNAGSIPSVTIENTDGATGVVEIAGGDLLLGRKTADDATFTPVNIIFEGATNDGNETTLTIADPTADQTITLPNSTGTVYLMSWSAVTSDQSLVVNTGVLANKSSGTLTLTLPTTAALGTSIRVSGIQNTWRVAQNSGQLVNFGKLSTTTGTGGYIESSNARDCVELVCCVANTEWNVVSSIGNITIV